MSGPFERHGIVPEARLIGRMADREAARATMEALAGYGLLHADVGWEKLDEEGRLHWVNAFTEAWRQARKEAAQAAEIEVLAREKLALAWSCPKCAAREGTHCWDMRTARRVHIVHPHQERMEEIGQ